jgi:hypothetical protein
MRRIAPTFMKIAFADPTLWPRQPNLAGVSLAHALVSPQFELTRFVFMDAISSLALGFPPLIEYDTSHPPIRAQEVHPMEWVHGCPAELVAAIIKINIWRAHNQAGGGEDMDRVSGEIEAAAWAWRPRYDYGPERNSWKVVARLAILEGWRHATLIYLYMVCPIAPSIRAYCLTPCRGYVVRPATTHVFNPPLDRSANYSMS